MRLSVLLAFQAIHDISEQNGIALIVSPQRRASTGTCSRRMAARRNNARHDQTAELLMMVLRAGADQGLQGRER